VNRHSYTSKRKRAGIYIYLCHYIDSIDMTDSGHAAFWCKSTHNGCIPWGSQTSQPVNLFFLILYESSQTLMSLCGTVPDLKPISLGGDCRGNVPRLLWATDYGPKLWIQSVPSSSKRLGNHTPHTSERPHHSRLKRRDHKPKKN
jgi:hypothetical protein